MKLKDSPGSPLTARGFTVVWFGPAFSGSDWVHVCVIVSGLYWKTMTLAIAIGPAGRNSTSAPRR